MNPGVTLTFLRLGKIAPGDAAGYIAAQFVGGVAGIVMGVFLLGHARGSGGGLRRDDTRRGRSGRRLRGGGPHLVRVDDDRADVSNAPRLRGSPALSPGHSSPPTSSSRRPVSGMSMNPARTLGSNVLATMREPVDLFRGAAVRHAARRRALRLAARERRAVREASPHRAARCIFRCGHGPASTEPD